MNARFAREVVNAHYAREEMMLASLAMNAHYVREELSAHYVRNTIVFASRRQKRRMLAFAREETNARFARDECSLRSRRMLASLAKSAHYARLLTTFATHLCTIRHDDRLHIPNQRFRSILRWSKQTKIIYPIQTK
jgi:hypothetical protein